MHRIKKSEESEPITVHVDDIKPFIWKKHPKSWLDEPVENESEIIVEPSEIASESEERHFPVRSGDSPVQIRTRREGPVKHRLIYSPS